MDEYVQYHNPEYADFPVEEPGAFWVYTSKPAEGVRGSRIWLLARKRETREYYLAYWFIADRVVQGQAGDSNRVEGQSGAWLRPAVRIDQLEWFDTLRRHSGNFGLGLQRINDSDLATALRTAGGIAESVAQSANVDSTTPRGTTPSFSHSEIFPLIARLIVRAPSDNTGFVNHDAIVSAVLADIEGAVIVARVRTTSSWADDRSAASNMVAWFSQQITVGRSRWAEFFERERRDDVWAYRPKTTVPPPIAADIELSAIEGEPRMFFHVRRERDAALADAKREAARALDGRLTCEACGFVAQAKYPGLRGDVCEVHHRRPLAEALEPVATRLEDLAVLCANCHRAIHQTKPLMSVEDFRIRFLSRSPQDTD